MTRAILLVMDSFGIGGAEDAAQFGDAGAIIEGLRSVGKLAPAGDPDHVVVVLQDIDKAMLDPLRDALARL